MRRYLVVGNWKMHGCQASANDLVTELTQRVSAKSASCEMAVCPPAILLPYVAERLAGSVVSWGAQNVHEQREGAYTGEISAPMLADFNCRFVIIGHSERRKYFSESDADVAAKFVTAQQAGLTPILCLGESLEQREAGQTLDCITDQLQTVIDVAGVQAFRSAVIAYEPIWAIGTGKTATPQQAQEVHLHIRELIAQADSNVAQQLQILYGGSVNAANAAALFAETDIDGALVGGASLKAQEFVQIYQAGVNA